MGFPDLQTITDKAPLSLGNFQAEMGLTTTLAQVDALARGWGQQTEFRQNLNSLHITDPLNRRSTANLFGSCLITRVRGLIPKAVTQDLELARMYNYSLRAPLLLRTPGGQALSQIMAEKEKFAMATLIGLSSRLFRYLGMDINNDAKLVDPMEAILEKIGRELEQNDLVRAGEAAVSLDSLMGLRPTIFTPKGQPFDMHMQYAINMQQLRFPIFNAEIAKALDS